MNTVSGAGGAIWIWLILTMLSRKLSLFRKMLTSTEIFSFKILMHGAGKLNPEDKNHLEKVLQSYHKGRGIVMDGINISGVKQ